MTARGWPAPAPRLRRRGRRAAAARPEFLRLEARVLPATFTVNSFTDGVDANPGDGFARTADGRTTLRAAIMEANILTGSHSVVVPAGSYTLSIAGPNEDQAASGDLDIRNPISVIGAGAASTTIRGDGSDRIFDIFTSGNLTISDLTLTGGRANTGGALRLTSDANVTLRDVIAIDNQATGDGGAIGASGSTGLITVRGGLFQGNQAGGSGGAISFDGVTLFLSGATLTGNTAAINGGAINLVDSQGTGLAGAQIRVSTISSNSAGGAGGAAFVGAGAIAQVTDATITQNSATVAGGVNAVGTFGLGNSILAVNSAPQGSPDILGAVASQGFNIIGDGTGGTGFVSTDRVGTTNNRIDPQLSTLHLHGGLYPVHVPLPGSIAINNGSAFDVNDQRGLTRPSVGADIGSVEAQAFAISSNSGGQHAAAGTVFPTIQATITENGLGLIGAVVTFIAPTTGPSGTFADGNTAIATAGGVATAPQFTANFTPGTFNLRADAGGSTFVNIPLTIDPTLTGSLQLSGVPASIMSGQPIQITVTALTSSGAIDTGYNGTVTFTTSDPAGVVPQPYTFQASDQGRKTFTATLNTVGNQSIRVRDPNLPIVTANVNVTPVTNRFEFAAPSSVNEGEPFSITLTVRDVNGAIISNYVGPITFTSDDPRAVLPTGASFSLGDQGVKTFTGFVLYPLGPRIIRATAADGTTGQASIGVVNIGPTGLSLSTSAASLLEGQSLTLNGSFSNPDPQDTHTVVVSWGDGSTTTLNLGAGVFQFQSSHTYTDDPAGAEDIYPISVVVTDAAGGSTTGDSSVSVANVAPQLNPTIGIAIGNQDSPLGQPISFNDPGDDAWTAIVDFGDSSAPQTFPVGPNRAFTLNHVYTAEGTFRVTIRLRDDDGGSSAPLLERAVIFLPGTTGVQLAIVPAGASGTLVVGGATVTLNNLGGATPAFLLLGIIDPKALDDLNGSPTKDPSQLVSAYDIRVLDAGPASTLTAAIQYPNGQPGVDPAVQYFDTAANQFVAVEGSPTIPNSFVVNQDTRTVTFVLAGNSSPTVASLGGTVFTLSVPAPTPTPTSSQSNNTGSSPFQLIASTPQALVSLGGITKTPAGTTGLVGNTALTVALSASETIRRGGGDESFARRFVNSQTLSTAIEAAIEVKDFLVETFRMWLDDPPPMEAPVLPAADLNEQVQIREISVEVAGEAAHADAAPPLPADYQDVPLLQAATATDPLIAPSETHPWWLKAYEHRPETTAQQSDPIPLPPSDEPSEADRAAAIVGAVWLGGHALAISAPDREEEDDELPPRIDAEETSED